MQWNVRDLVTVADLARFFSTTNPVITNWSRRYSTFPAPIVYVNDGRTPLYSLRQVRRWYSRHPWDTRGGHNT